MYRTIAMPSTLIAVWAVVGAVLDIAIIVLEVLAHDMAPNLVAPLLSYCLLMGARLLAIVFHCLGIWKRDALWLTVAKRRVLNGAQPPGRSQTALASTIVVTSMLQVVALWTFVGLATEYCQRSFEMAGLVMSLIITLAHGVLDGVVFADAMWSRTRAVEVTAIVNSMGELYDQIARLGVAAHAASAPPTIPPPPLN